MTDLIREFRISKTRRLTSVNSLRESAVEERILVVKLMNRLVTRERKREHCTNGGWLDDRAESFIEINTFALSKPSEHPTSFVSFQRTIRLQLVMVDPLASNDVSIARRINEIPSVVGEKSTILLNHSGMPIRILESTTIGLRYWR